MPAKNMIFPTSDIVYFGGSIQEVIFVSRQVCALRITFDERGETT